MATKQDDTISSPPPCQTGPNPNANQQPKKSAHLDPSAQATPQQVSKKTQKSKDKSPFKKGLKSVGRCLAVPYICCCCIYHTQITERDPWGAPNHPKRREKKEMKKRAKGEKTFTAS
ncbi:hypothetical protein BU26DRAFT_569226 [Trematosphaeria pertusa]|uniref:Uncharacterized protein n=1 Tax=Trematosphaeria pertusa TaxID=390896 RepID=A0A6A6I1S2_9PLEO|nr:uncharacterized protein BU26DRAFT_569226 [Trematosphaeria pertusa]KAF2244227.1 hypothetical protein BU26DRAFT_569226 [Trematosphaeria pertusa]